MGDTSSVLAQIEQALLSKLVAFLSLWAGMAGGSITATVAYLGDQSFVAGVGVIMAVLGFVLRAWHQYSQRRLLRRIEYAKMTPEQREIFDNT